MPDDVVDGVCGAGVVDELVWAEAVAGSGGGLLDDFAAFPDECASLLAFCSPPHRLLMS